MIKSLLHPFTIFIIALLVSLAMFYLKKNVKLAKGLLITSVIWLLLCSSGFLPRVLIENLENRNAAYIPIADTSHYHIIVLGGGHVEDPQLPANAQLNVTALGRLVEGIRIHRLLPSSKLILSGYAPDNGQPQAEILKKTALLLGVRDGEILVQDKPSNTYEEAKEYTRLFKNSSQLIVVTSATHMPRALKMFKMFGIKPIAAPTNFLIRTGGAADQSWFPSTDNMNNMHVAIKEYVALLAAQWRY